MYRYHAFLSHNGAQKEWTRKLAKELRDAGLSVFFDEDSIELGEDVPAAIEDALRRSRHVLLVLSPEAIESQWVALEYSASLYRDANNADRVLLPILKKDCDIPLTIARLRYLDARSGDLKSHVSRLLNAIEAVELEPVSSSELPIPTRAPAKRVAQPKKSAEQPGTIPPVGPVARGDDYIERDADLVAKRAIEDREIFVVSGPRRSGKTSLLFNTQSYAESLGRQFVYLDFSIFGSGPSVPQVYYSFAEKLANELALPKPDAKLILLNPGAALSDFLEKVPENTVLALDEFDALSSIDALGDFAIVLRSTISWKESTFAILIASNQRPYRFIENPVLSPFNVGRHAHLVNLSRTEAERLIRRAVPDISATDADHLYELFGGQPYLLSAGLQELRDGVPIEELPFRAQSPSSLMNSQIGWLKHRMGEKLVVALAKNGVLGLAVEDLEKLVELGVAKVVNGRADFASDLFSRIFAGGLHKEIGA